MHAATGRLAAVLVWLAFSPAILRGLGTEGFGLWALFFAFTGHFGALDFGLVQGTLRHVAAARERGDHGEAGEFAALAVVGFAVLAIAWLAVMLLAGNQVLEWLRIPAGLMPAARFAILGSALVFAVTGFANVVMAVAQGYGRFDLANLVTLALTAQHAIGIPIVLHNGWGLRGLVINVGLGWALGAILGLMALRFGVREFHWRRVARPGQRLREALTFGGPLQLTNVLSVVNLNLDKFLLSRLVSLSMVTPYEFGIRVANTAMTFPQLLLLASMPAAASAHAAGRPERLQQLYARGNRWVLLATAVTIAAVLAGSRRLFAVWLGGAHEDAVLVLEWGVIALGISMLAGMASAVARGIGRTGLEAWFHVASTGVHLTLSLVLLPIFGLSGALIGLVSGTAAGALTFLLLLSGTLGWSRYRVLLWDNLVPAAAATAGSLAGLALDRWLPAPPGLAGWGLLALVSGSSGAIAMGTSLAFRYVDLRDMSLSPIPQ